MGAAVSGAWRRPLIGLLIGTAVLLALLSRPFEVLVARWYYLSQDFQGGLALLALWLLGLFWRPGVRFRCWSPSTPAILALAAIFAILLWLASHVLMLNYALTRDELMAEFDSAVFAKGRLALPLPTEWSGYALALVPAFLLDVPDNALLISAYGPVNAAMRAAFGAIADPALLNPLLAGAGLVLLHRISRHLFPDCQGAQWVVIGGYLLSAQIAVNAMTTYAMTAHLTFNLAWLALFLRDRWWSHGFAMAIGVAAVGLHQVVFHPLFAGPFLLLLLARRRFALVAVYAGCYAAAAALWFSWPQIVAVSGGIVTDSGTTAGSTSFFAERVVPLLFERDQFTLPLMEYNLLRLVVWNAAFVLPFLLLAAPAIRRREGLSLPLAAGIVLTLLTMAILLPYQGHGWGYRYMHGLLANAFLLAGYGYRELARRRQRDANGLGLVLGAGTVPIVAWLLVTTHQFVQPYAQLTELVSQQESDFVIVDTEPPANAIDQVRNRPDLTNRPLVFASHALAPDQVRELCARGTVTLLRRRDFHVVGFGIDTLPAESPSFDRRVAPIVGQDCVRDVSIHEAE